MPFKGFGWPPSAVISCSFIVYAGRWIGLWNCIYSYIWYITGSGRWHYITAAAMASVFQFLTTIDWLWACVCPLSHQTSYSVGLVGCLWRRRFPVDGLVINYFITGTIDSSADRMQWPPSGQPSWGFCCYGSFSESLD